MNNQELMQLRSDSMVMECLHEIAMDLPVSERAHYVDIVTEAMADNPDNQLKLIMKLSKQTESLQQIDLDQCQKSGGDITRYAYYDAMAQAMDIINESEFTRDIPNVIRMNSIHNILLNNRDDFAWGFKAKDTITMKSYILMTRLLFIMIDLSLADYIRKLDVSFKFNTKIKGTPKKVISAEKDADRMIKVFESGKWRTLMTSVRSASARRTARALDEMNGTAPPKSMATEASASFSITLPTSRTGAFDPVSAAGSAFDWFKNINVGFKIGAIVILILISYRHIAFLVAKAFGWFSNVVRHAADLIKAHEMANHNQSASAVEKQNKVYNALVGTADHIDAFFNKASAQADAAVSEANRTELNTNEINTINGIDFGV